MKNWNTSDYQKIREATLEDGSITVRFENGDVITIPRTSLIPFGFKDVVWERMQNTSYEITVPASPNSFEIPWDALRVITDKEFAKHLADKSDEQAKQIGVKIKRLREKKSFSGKELAERAGVSAQTISRIEQGHTDVSFATLRKILSAMGYSLKDLANQELELEMEGTQKSFNLLIKRLNSVGIDSNLLTKKIIPQKLQKNLHAQQGNESPLLLDEAAHYVSKIYDWPINQIWSGTNLNISSRPSEMAFFKKPTNANENQIKAYSHYAYYLAKVVLKTNTNNKGAQYPESLEDFKQRYFAKTNSIDFRTLLEFVWDLGICVLPLNDAGVFHGASWNIDGKHVVILKQNNRSHARWIFDLLHELYHVFYHLDEENTSVIESEELNPFSNNESVEELEANSFANQIIFGNRAEELAEKCVSLANWDIRKLTDAVNQVAKKENVRLDFLSNYMAFRLSYQGENWWGSAVQMQITEPNPFEISAEILRNRLQLQNLGPMEYNLLNTAINN